MLQTAPARQMESTSTQEAPKPKRNPLNEIVVERLRSSGYAELSKVACRCSGGTAHLSGQVCSYHMKQVAQEIVRRVDEIRQVRNHIEVIVRKGEST